MFDVNVVVLVLVVDFFLLFGVVGIICELWFGVRIGVVVSAGDGNDCNTPPFVADVFFSFLRWIPFE